jgi:hypothetical protein
MEALVCMVDHRNEQYEANLLGWGNVISSAHNLLTCRDLHRFASLCNDGCDAVQGEYYLYKHWQSLFVGRPAYIQIRNGVEGEGHKEDKESDNNSWGGSDGTKGGCEYFLVYHQWIAYFEGLQFHPEEASRYEFNRGFETSAEFFLTYVDVYLISTQKNPMKIHTLFQN